MCMCDLVLGLIGILGVGVACGFPGDGPLETDDVIVSEEVGNSTGVAAAAATESFRERMKHSHTHTLTPSHPHSVCTWCSLAVQGAVW